MSSQPDQPMPRATTETGRLVHAILTALNVQQVAYCVMRNYAGLPDEVGNDLDLAVDKKHLRPAAEAVLSTMAARGWSVMRQVRRQGTRSIYCGRRDASARWQFMHVDLCTDSLLRRRRWSSVKRLVASRRSYNGFFIPSPGAEAAMVVRGLLAGGTVREKYRAQCAAGVAEDEGAFRACLAGYFSDEVIGQLAAAMAKGDWSALGAASGQLRRHWRLRALLRRPFGQVALVFRFLAERLAELSQPNGLFLALIGPDGSGKTTIAKGVEQRMGQAVFAASSYSHVRPGWLPPLSTLLAFATGGKRGHRGNDRVGPSPSTELPALRVFVNVCYYWTEFMAAHCTIRRSKSKGHLIIYDRYFFEYFIQIGYRRISRGLLRILVKLVPQPDLVVYLRNSPEVIRRRKAELTEDVIRYQLQMCERVIADHANGVAVDTDKPIDSVVDEVVDHVVSRLLARSLP